MYCNITAFCAVKSLRHRCIALKNKQNDLTSEANVDFSLEPHNLVNVFNSKAFFSSQKKHCVYFYIHRPIYTI